MPRTTRLPALIGEWFRRLHYLLRRRALEEELRREMEAHREMMRDPRAFGNTLRLREEAHDAWGWTWLDAFAQDARFALRTLGRSPGFALTAIATLALGIGVNIGMFTLVDAMLLRPLYDRPDEVVAISSRSTTPAGGDRWGVSYPNYLELREATAGVLENLSASSLDFVGLDAGAGVRRAMSMGVTANYFSLFGVPLALGRPFTAEEERLGADTRVAIISHSLWQQRGGDSSVLGQSIRIDAEPFTIVGVAAEGFTGPAIPGPEVWTPLGAGARNTHRLSIVGRLRDGASIERVDSVLDTAGRRLAQAFPDVNGGYTFATSALSRLMFMPGAGSAMTATIVVSLMIMPAIVLLVACLNLADLMLARGLARRRELAIRSSLGGGRWRLTRQLLTEGLILALAGGAAGLILSMWAANALIVSVQPVLPFSLTLPEFDLGWRVFAGTVGFSLAATLLFSAWPAWVLTGRAAATDLKRQSGDEGRRRPGSIWIGNGLAIGQVALSILLLAAGGLFLMSALSASTADPGFRLDGGLLVEIDPDLAGYDEAQARRTQLALVDRLRTVPGVEAVTIASGFPFTSMEASRRVAPAGVPADSQSASVSALFTVVGRDYARVLGLPMLAGRDFSDAELVPGSPERVAIVDDELARRLWPGEDALGRSIQFAASGANAGQPIRIVGIVPAVNHSLGNPRPFPHVYVPLGQRYEHAMTLQLRIAGSDLETSKLATIARIVREADERVPVLRVETWREHLDGSLEVWLYRTGARVFSAFGAIALVLAVIGVYGVKSFVVSRRTREFGIRIAIGAHPRAVLFQVLREDGRITAVGIAIGVLLALAAGQLLQGFLYGVNAVEPVVLIAAPLILLASSLVASYLPALRATKVDPTVALRVE